MTTAHERADVEDWRCPDCGCRSYARVDERKPDGKYAPGLLIRCVNCKRDHVGALRTSPEQSGKPDREAVARIIRAHVKVDATGLSPGIASVFMLGFEEAADAILTALFPPPGYTYVPSGTAWATESLALPAPPPSTSPEARVPEELDCRARELITKGDGVCLTCGETSKRLADHCAYSGGIGPMCEWKGRSLLQRGDHGER